ncbi:copia protein [Tanacetum coccineum]
MAVRDFKKFFKRRGKFVRQPRNNKKTFQRSRDNKNDKNQKAFVGGSWSDNSEEDDEKVKDGMCLVAQASSKVCSESSYFSDENSSIDDLVLDNEYDKLCKMSLNIITKNQRLKATRNSLEKELGILKEKGSTLEKNKGVDLECVKCHMLKIKNEKLKVEAIRLTIFEKSTHCLNEMLSKQKPSREILGLGFNSFEASSSGTKEVKFMKAQKMASSDGGPINMGGPHIVQAPPKEIIGPLVITSGSEKSVSFQKSILGPRPKHIIVNNVKVPVASDDEVKRFYKPLSKPGVGFSKPNFRSKTPPPRRFNNNYPRHKTPQPKRNVGRQNQPHGFPICLGVDLEPDEWIKDSGCSKHITGNQKLFSIYKAYNRGQIFDNKCRVTFSEHDSEITKDGKVIGHVNMRLIQSLASKKFVRNLPKLKFYQHFYDACKIRKQAHASHKAKNIVSTTRCLELLHMNLFSSSAVRCYRGNHYTLVIVDDYYRKPTLDYFRVFGSKCFILNTKDYLTKFDPKSYEGVFLGYSQNSKAYIILNKHTKKVKESLNMTFDDIPPPSKTSPLVDDDLDEEEAIKVTEKKNLENDIEDETLEINEVVNIKEFRNYPLENVIGNLNQRTLRLVAQGYNQQEGNDYDETYAPVARLVSIMITIKLMPCA